MLDPNEWKASCTQTECIQGLMTFLERFGSVFFSLFLTLKLANQDWSQRHFFSNLPPVHRSPPQIVLNYVVFGYFHRLLWCANMNFPHLIRVSRGYLSLLAARRKPKWTVVTWIFFLSAQPLESTEMHEDLLSISSAIWTSSDILL